MATTNFTPTPAEFALVNQIFAQADTQKTGILTGDVAVKVFSGSKLPSTVLGEIWSIADGKNDGFLTKKGVAIALRLMGHAQKGDKVHKSLLSKRETQYPVRASESESDVAAPLAVIEGIHAPVVQQSTGMSIPNSPPLTPGLPPLTPQDRAKFNRLFQSCGPVDGLLSGDKARNMFIKSKLPVDVLSQIWSLCDTHERGALDSVDFTVAMYLIQLTMSGKLSFVPTTLPPGLYEQASGSLTAQVTGGSAHLGTPASSTFPFPPTKQSPVHPQFTGQGAHNIPPALPSRRPGPAAQTPMIPPFPSATAQASVPWDVTPAEKASSDQFFDTLDTHKRGYIEGDVAVPFMLLSKLPEDVLAQVWDISDINNDGRLTRDGFAVALHLIQGKLAGKDIPNTLPPTLVPPSMRKTISPFTTAAPSRSSEPTRDLLWDEPSPTSNVYHQPQPAHQPQLTGAQAPARIYAPPAASQAPQDPFGTSFSDSSFNKDLLGDDDDTPTSPPFHDQSAEIGNAQNQLNSTNKSLQTAKSERENLETTLASQAAQLSALQTQLATAKASFETETTLLNSLRERHATQTADIQKVREELIRSESDLSAVRVEKAELEGSFLRDKEEVRELNKKMLEITNQIATTKQEVEKVKKEAKQQKGLLAIARKQFATKESEKTRVDKELEEARTDLVNVTKEREEEEVGSAVPSLAETIERAKSPADSLAFAAAQPLPLTPDLTGATSPTSAKSNNPFGKLVKSVESSTPRSQSPFRPFSAVPAPSSSPPPTNLPLSPETNPFGLRRASDAKPQEIFQETLDNHVTDGHNYSSYPNFSTPVSDTPVNQDNDAARVHMFEAAVTHFPALEEMAEEPPAASEKHTDLSVALHDLDVEESDSDSDGDDDTNGKAPHEETQAFKPFSPTKETSSEPVQIFFEGAFGGAGQSMEGPIVPEPASTQEAEISSPALDPFGVLMKSAETHQNSLSSSAKGAGNTTFTEPPQTSSSFFEDTFGENFDFGSQSTTEKIPIIESPLTTAAPVNGNIPKDKAPASHGNGGFDLFFQPMSTSTSAVPKEEPQPTAAHISFESDSGPWNTSQTQPGQTDPNQPGLAGITFDEAFGGLDSSQALRLGDSLSSRSSKVIMSPAPDSGTAFPAVSPPTSPHGPSRIASGRPTSPHARATSPPPRVASPKTLRSSTSSSRDVTHEKPAPPPRHSKLSLRLPFVKKKKHDQAPPLPPSSLSRRANPIREQTGPPGVEDDDESVKQLSAMGFSRDQAVAALEANDYDMQRTLNSLLGAQ
ncbi:hypothetical protein EDC04DRAFT_2600428 [Pisolithus marmoratus]|nr:hypothetical protein EDC04DRAFT_2600428 [Pisolithus marmoratus]